MRLYFCVFFLCGLLSCHGDEKKASGPGSSYAVIGKITGLDSGWVYVSHNQSSPRRIDSSRIDHGYFTFAGRADTAEHCSLRLTHGDKTYYPGDFFLERGKTAMLLYIDSPQLNKISGTPLQEEYNRFNASLTEEVEKPQIPLEKAFGEARVRKDKPAMDRIEKQLDHIDSIQKNIVTRYAALHPASLLSPYELYTNFSYNPDPQALGQMAGRLDPIATHSYYGRKLDTVLQKARLTDIGQPAPGFSLPDATGKSVALAAFQGRVTLVDFWASWCGPCRRENPNVLKAYNAYHAKGFDILGVSCDESKDDWLQAVKKDGLVWTQVCDMKGWPTEPYQLYGIMGIPMNYLVGRDGKIIGKGLRGEELMAKLKAVMP